MWCVQASESPTLSVEQIFSRDHAWIPGGAVLVATGDVIPARVTDVQIRKYGAGFPFAHVGSLLTQDGMTIANLESPLTSACQATMVGMSFCGTTGFADAMKMYGVTIATLENNHIGNRGIAGIEETKRVLDVAGIGYVRRDAPLYVTWQGMKFAFLAVNGVGPRVDRDALSTQVSEARLKADIVVMSVHWGREYTYDPMNAAGIAPDDPVDLGHFMVDAGVDLVIGNHPHWVQGIELYHGGFISYAHGNFIFDQEWSRETQEGVVGRYVFKDKKLADVSYTPIVIEHAGQPREAIGNEGDKILRKMYESSVRLRGARLY